MGWLERARRLGVLQARWTGGLVRPLPRPRRRPGRRAGTHTPQLIERTRSMGPCFRRDDLAEGSCRIHSFLGGEYLDQLAPRRVDLRMLAPPLDRDLLELDAALLV